MFLFRSASELRRKDACGLCSKPVAALVGRVNYIGLREFDVVQCTDCGLISWDPSPDGRILGEGCDALYRIQQSAASRKSIIKGFGRSYRLGNHFARKYLTRHFPLKHGLRVLEIGPGDGYFSQGVANQYREADVHYLDISSEVASYLRSQFRCTSHLGDLEDFAGGNVGEFDLIVLRDLLEHVRIPGAFLRKARKLLSPNGVVFLITPNGLEDFWGVNQRLMNRNEAHLVELNHVHFFLPETLEKLLGETGFRILEGFKYGSRRRKRGMGYQEITKFEANRVPVIPSASLGLQDFWRHSRREVDSGRLNDGGWLSRLYMRLHEQESDRFPFHAAQGDEFFVIAGRS